MRVVYLFFLVYFSFLWSVVAQRPTGTFPGGGSTPYSNSSTSNSSPLTAEVEDPDTAQIIYFHAQQPDNQLVLSDTSLGNHFQQYMPTRVRNDEYATLGYAGSAAKPVVFQSYNRMGFDLGFHQFDAYFFKHQDARFYNVDRSFSQGKWTFRSLGNDSNLDFEYGGHYKKNMFLTLTWHRINTSTTGNYKFKNQSAVNSNWGLHLGQLGKRYNWFLGMVSNGFQQTDNGGITTDTSLTKRNSGLIGGLQSVPIRLSGSVTTAFTQRDVQWRHTWNLVQNEAAQRDFQLVHQANYRITKYKAFDKFGVSRTEKEYLLDSIFFRNIGTDDRGSRLYLATQNIDNQFSIASAKKNLSGQISEAGNTFEAGIRHQWFRVNKDISTENIQNLFAFGKINFNQFKRFQLNTYAHLGLSAATAGEYRAEGTIFFDLKPLGTLEGKLIQQRFQPTFLETYFVNTRQEVWKNDYKKMFETALSANYKLPKIGFSAEAVYRLMNNYIYFNENLKPSQESNGISIFQLNLSESLRNKHFGIENFVSYQQSSSKNVHLPALTGKHGIFVEGKIFRKKVMLARFGFDFRYTTKYQADAYHPLLGQFYWQEQTTIPFFPSADVYLNAKVSTTRVFVKVENVTRFLYKDKVFYNVPNYPLYDTYFRIGIQRRFID